MVSFVFQPFTKQKNLDVTLLKEFADDKFNIDKMMIFTFW